MVSSARFAAFGFLSVTRSRWGGRPGFWNASERSTAVPLRAATCPAGTTSVLSSFAMLPFPLVRLGRQPDGECHHGTEAEDPEEEALRHRSEPAEGEAADVLGRLLRLQRRDDVGLVLRRQVV